MNRLYFEEETIHENHISGQKQKMEGIVFDFLKSIDGEERIFIFGAGNVAKCLCKEIEKNGKLDIIKAFIVSKSDNNPNELNGIPVREYMNYIDAPEKIIIGLQDTNQEEIYSELVKSGINESRIVRLPFSVNQALDCLHGKNEEWESSEKYWNNRYKYGGNSGPGSYNRLAEFKAEIINKFVHDHKINSVIEWGCGDGNQLSLADYTEYIGYDISKKAIDICRKKFERDERKRFIWCGGEDFKNEMKADLTLSLDVIYHLVEDNVYEIYMDRLFGSSLSYVCIYSCDFENRLADYIKCRKFTDYVKTKYKEWKLIEYYPNRYPYLELDPENTSWSEFFFYQKQI